MPGAVSLRYDGGFFKYLALRIRKDFVIANGIITPRHVGAGRYLITAAGSLKDPGLRRDDSGFFKYLALRIRKDFVIAKGIITPRHTDAGRYLCIIINWGQRTIDSNACCYFIFTWENRIGKEERMMARKPRFNITGIPQHVVQRGNNRAACFFAERDYRRYIKDLREASEVSGCDVHAYVLMSNHVHLLVTPQVEQGVSQLMQSIGRRYVRYINQEYGRSGSLWDGRYRACLVEAEPYLLTCHRFIEQNPVRIGVVAQPGDYRWSSYAYNAGEKRNEWLCLHDEYLALGKTKAERRQAYRELLKQPLGVTLVRKVRETLAQEQVLGSESFKDAMEAVAERPVRPGKAGRPRLEEEWEEYWVF